ncbi:hypothetical protein AAGS40_00910 [Paraburkholderia sp. PREW-6R]|uniref:hypothetical protein n=1 Tax=Paraburkholderia sp. PREW-6R TaxID=3141544 RepID=UPI0031F59BC2
MNKLSGMFALLMFSVCAYSASIVEYCKPYTAVSQIAVDLKKPFIQYFLDVETMQSKRKAISIIGDEIVVSRDTIGPLVRDAANADAEIESVRLDGRIVRFVGPLSLVNASIQVFADEVIFSDGSAIVLLPDKNSKITIAARQTTLADSGFRHFDVHARKTQGATDDFSDISQILQIYSDRLLVGSAEVPPSQLQKKLSERFSRYPFSDFTKKIDAVAGGDGHEHWVALQKKEAVGWPAYSVGVLKAAFRVAPFDDCTREGISGELNSLLPTLKDIASGSVVFDTYSILDSIKGGVDLEGNGPAFATVRPLADLLNELGDYGSGGKKTAALDFYINILANSVANTPIDLQLQRQQTSELSEKVRQSTIDYQNTNGELINIQSSIDATVALLRDQQAAYKARETRLEQYADELKKGAQDRAQIISALSTAGAIATTAYSGNPQTGAAVGGVIYTVGMSTEGRKPFESLSAGVQFASAIQGPLASISKTVADIKTSRATYGMFIESFNLQNITIKSEVDVPVANPKPGQAATTKLTRDDALKDLAEKGRALKSGIDDLEKVYKDFVPQPSPVPAVVEEDSSLKELASQVATTLEQAKTLTIRLDAAQRKMQEQSTALATNAEQLSRMSNLPVQNEARRRMLGQMAIDGSREELSSFASIVDQVRRISIVEFREPLPVSASQIQNAFASEQLEEGLSKQSVLSQKEVGALYLDLLTRRKTQIIFLANFVSSASKRQFEQYVQNRGGAPTIVLATEEISDSDGAPPNDRRFIRQLNQLVESQFKARKDPVKLQALQSRQIELPLDVRNKIDQRFPARLLQIVITDIRPRYNLGGGDIVFRVEVERVGNLRKAAVPNPPNTPVSNLAERSCAVARPANEALDCFSVDLRAKTTPPEYQFLPFEYTVGTIIGGRAFVPTPAQSFWYLRPGDTAPSTGRTMLVTYSPAEARMFLRVRLDPRTSWATAPVFKRLTVSAEVFQ